MTPDVAPKANLQWIQALRGLAALMVLFFHMRPHWDLAPLLAVTGAATRWGFSGVDIFFALSGFVVYRSAQRTIPTKGIWPFARKRLARIYLGYWPVLVLIVLLTIFVYHSSLPTGKKMLFSTLLLYPNIWDNWLAPAWSLTMEVYFYVWIALITLMPARHQLAAICCAMAVLLVWGVGWLVGDPARVFQGQQPLRYALTGLGLEFLAGALIARAYDHRAWVFQNQNARTTAPLCAVLIAAGLALGTTSPYFDRVEVMRAASFGVVGVSALMLALMLEQTRFAPPAWLVAVGDASYSPYLLHTVLLDFSGRLRGKWGLTSPDALLAFLLALPVVIVLLSLLWYRWVEKSTLKLAS